MWFLKTVQDVSLGLSSSSGGGSDIINLGFQRTIGEQCAEPPALGVDSLGVVPGLDAQQVPHEEIAPTASAIGGLCDPMPASGDH